MYVLIILVLSYGFEFGAVSQHDYSSESACMAARAAIDKVSGRDVRTMCVPK